MSLVEVSTAHDLAQTGYLEIQEVICTRKLFNLLCSILVRRFACLGLNVRNSVYTLNNSVLCSDRGHARTFLKDLEKIRPSSILGEYLIKAVIWYRSKMGTWGLVNIEETCPRAIN